MPVQRVHSTFSSKLFSGQFDAEAATADDVKHDDPDVFALGRSYMYKNDAQSICTDSIAMKIYL